MFNYEDLKNLVREVLKEHRSSLNEGGNIFKGDEGGSETIRIKRDDVDPTLEWLEGILGIDLVDFKLGTTGKKETSGDLDIAIDENKVSKDDLDEKLMAWVNENHPELELVKLPDAQKEYDRWWSIKLKEVPRQDREEIKKNREITKKELVRLKTNKKRWIARSGTSVHFKTPIRGDESNGFVQTDLMFGNPKFMLWAVQGEPEGSEYRGGDRQNLINAIATQKGYAWSAFFGLKDRTTGKIITTDRQEVVDKVLGPGHKPEDFNEIKTLFGILNDPKNRTKYPDNIYKAIEEKAGFKLPPRVEGEPESLDEAKKDSPRIQHAEDLIFFEGSKGAIRALDALEKMNNPEGRPETTLKWDGSPAVYFGRDKEGNFIFTDKGGFVAKGDKGRANSKEEIDAMYRARSGRAADKSDMTAEEIYQQKYSKISPMMQKAFELVEKSLDSAHRGYFFGEVLYFDKPAVEDGKFVFKPNMVKYKVATDSEMGKKIAKSDVGIVVHSEKDVNEKPILGKLNLKPLSSPDPRVIFFGKTFIEKPVDVDDTEVTEIKQMVSTNSKAIDDFFNYEKLRKLTISNLPNIFYAYLNGKVDTGLENLGSDLIDWMEGKKALTSSKKKNITDYIQQNQETYNKIWEIVSRTMKVKDDIIANIDSQGGLEFSQSLGDEEVGEGYVLSDEGKLIKLVDRSKFTRANRSVVREQNELDPDYEDDLEAQIADIEDAGTHVFIPGGFKPPHKGHLSLLLKAIQRYPNSKIRIVSGPKERTAGEKDDEDRLEISADQAKQVWKKYIDALGISNEVDLDYFEPFETTGGKMSISPLVRIGHVTETEIAPKDKSAKIVLVSPFQKYADYVAGAVKYLNKKFKADLVADPIIVGLIEKEPGVKFSATDMRNSIKDGNFETFATFMPEELSGKDAKEVFAILGGNKDELEETSLAGAVVGHAGPRGPVKRKKRNKRTIYNMRENLNHEESILKQYLVERYVEKFTNLLSEATDSATATGMTYVTDAFNTTRANFEKRYNGLGEQDQRTSFLVNFLNKMVHGFIQQDIGEGIAPVMPFDELVEKGIITLDIGQSGAQFAQSALEEQEVTLGITDEEEELDLVPDEEGEAQAEKEQEDAEKMKAGKVSPDVTDEPLPGTNETGNRAASSYYNLDSKNIFRFYNLIGPEDIDDREQFVEFYFKNIVALAAGIERSKTGGELPEPLNSMFNKLSGSGDVVKEPELEDEVAPAQPEGEMTLEEAVTEDDISTIIKQSVIKTFRDLQF
tara:strand:+ start:1082 stop:4852 length:3771 start_codon:yes stop_codon:yes gene_type:complete